MADTSAGEVTPSNYWYDVPMDRSRQRAGRPGTVGAAAPRRSPGFTAGSNRGYTTAAPSTAAAEPGSHASWPVFSDRSPGFTAGSSRGYTAPAPTAAAGEAGGAATQALGIGELPPAPAAFEPEIYWICQDQDGKQYRC